MLNLADSPVSCHVPPQQKKALTCAARAKAARIHSTRRGEYQKVKQRTTEGRLCASFAKGVMFQKLGVRDGVVAREQASLLMQVHQ
jgi:hypothetical protein